MDTAKRSCLILTVAASIFALHLAVSAQNPPAAPTVSTQELTNDQVLIYRAVLEDYLKGTRTTLNVADRTEPLEITDDGCAKDFTSSKSNQSRSVIHRLPTDIAPKLRLVWVDPDQQQKLIDDNDPQKLIKSAIDDHQNVSNKQLERSVKTAFSSGLFTLSEIAFDDLHQTALVSYSFVCGGLCGHGNTLVLERSGKTWKIKKRCGGWIS